MKEEEVYRYLGSHPCEDCDNCKVNEKLEYTEEGSIKPRHYPNGDDMRMECHFKYPCLDAVEYDIRYNELITS